MKQVVPALARSITETAHAGFVRYERRADLKRQMSHQRTNPVGAAIAGGTGIANSSPYDPFPENSDKPM